MAITPEQFRDMCQPLFNLKAHITRIERQLAEAQAERDKALAENVRLRAALRAISQLEDVNSDEAPLAAHIALSGGPDDD